MIRQQVQSTSHNISASETARLKFFTPGRLAIMIDGNSIHYALHALNADMDYRKLRGLFGAEKDVVRAAYYALTVANDEFAGRALLDWLHYNGYSVREKTVRGNLGSNAQRSARGRVSLEMAVDAFDMAPLLDHLIIFSGDGDLAAMVEAIQRKGVQVTAVSTLTTRPQMIATELRRQVDRFIDLRELMPFVGRAVPRIDAASI